MLYHFETFRTISGGFAIAKINKSPAKPGLQLLPDNMTSVC